MGVVSVLAPTGYAPSNKDLADRIRRFAEDVEDGCWDDSVKNVICIIEDKDGVLHRQTFGNIIDYARVVGLLTLSITREI